MTPSPLPDTVDAATRLKPGDNVRVEGFIAGSFDNRHVRIPGSDYVLRLADIDEYVELVDAPAPYTEPRDRDEVEVAQKPIRGHVKTSPGRAWLVNTHDSCLLSYDEFAEAQDDGRVRLVKAAAPRFEAGRIYRSESTLADYQYTPGILGVAGCNWYDIGNARFLADPANVPADLVPCDVVPTGEGA